MSQLSIALVEAAMVEDVEFEPRDRSKCRDSCHNLYDDYYYEHDLDMLYRDRETFAVNNSILTMELDHMLQKIKKIEEELLTQICQSEDDTEMAASASTVAETSSRQVGPNSKIYVEQIGAVEVEDKYIGTLNSEPPKKKMRR